MGLLVAPIDLLVVRNAIKTEFGATYPVIMIKHTKCIVVILLLAICSQSLAAASLSTFRGENVAENTSAIDHANHDMDELRVDVASPKHVHGSGSEHEERCKFKCECTLGGCFNAAQLLSFANLVLRLNVEGNFGQLGQIAQSQAPSPLYRPPIFR